ncbi:hypothetical protein FPZ12_000135 [Amycolatopsis acidicola]|uniref:Uncharacterized protein n=1 Tax=Amycolatopsis acidicola TaxID=2596893 RepID=A0A5N0VPD0_9PSEU|nr:hypothetical protein [Amycolatopsis acidicola]KAA9166672.1 hypothetical protein FPZ12_000135 [Amycolatopsis acidicola]
MKQYNAANRRGTARASRWFSRALLVVGGAVAGTAAAWAIGTASASAEVVTTPQADSTATQEVPGGQVDGDQFTPFTDAAIGASDDVVAGASNLAGDAAGTAVKFGTGQFRDGVERDQHVADSVHEFTRTAVLHPAQRLLGSAEHITRKPQDAPKVIGQALTPPKAVLDLLHPSGAKELIDLPQQLAEKHGGESHAPAVTAPKAAPVPAAPMGPITTVISSAHNGIQHAGLHFSQQGKDQHVQRGHFPLAPQPGPLAPSGIPFVPNGSTTGGHLDGSLLGVPAHSLTVVDTQRLRALRFGIRHTPVEPGTQPGVTPD